jgi:hypothetical protein
MTSANTGIRIYDVASQALIDEIAGANFGDIDGDGSRLVFRSNQNYTGGNADGGYEIFLWDNETITQITQSTNISHNGPKSAMLAIRLSSVQTAICSRMSHQHQTLTTSGLKATA